MRTCGRRVPDGLVGPAALRGVSTLLAGNAFDLAVIGADISGLVAAAALARRGRRVLVLERQAGAGGEARVFERDGFRFDAGFLRIEGSGDEGHEGLSVRMLRWLSDHPLSFAALRSPTDVVVLPGGFEFSIEPPRPRLVESLNVAFPAAGGAIDDWFARCDRVRSIRRALFATQARSWPASDLMRLVHRRRLQRAVRGARVQALAQESDARLAAVLSARWSDHGLPPSEVDAGSLAAALAVGDEGACYPAGGPGAIVRGLVATIEHAGGQVRTGAAVESIEFQAGRVCGLRLKDGGCVASSVVISALRLADTLALLPASVAKRRSFARLRAAAEASAAGRCHRVFLHLGLRGDVRAAGAIPADIWLQEHDGPACVWSHPVREAAPAMLVSFPTLKDPQQRTATRHTVQVSALCRHEPFQEWAHTAFGNRKQDYEAAKGWIGEALFAQFSAHFPALARMVEVMEVTTPLADELSLPAAEADEVGAEAQAESVPPGAAPAGSSRIVSVSQALGATTPVAGLLIAGPEATYPGAEGALLAGFFAAASIDPSLWDWMRR